MSATEKYAPYDDPEGYKRARAVAQWELGDPGWATIILDAFHNADDPNAVEALEEIAKP